MTTLREAVLRHECPNCGVKMQRALPKQPSRWAALDLALQLLLVIAAGGAAFSDDYARAAWLMAVAIFVRQRP